MDSPLSREPNTMQNSISGLWDQDLSRRQVLYPLTHPGAPHPDVFAVPGVTSGTFMKGLESLNCSSHCSQVRQMSSGRDQESGFRKCGWDFSDTLLISSFERNSYLSGCLNDRWVT